MVPINLFMFKTRPSLHDKKKLVFVFGLACTRRCVHACCTRRCFMWITSDIFSCCSGEACGYSYLLRGVVSVVLLPPDFGVHLQTDILEVNISIHLLNVPLGHIVLCMTPVTAAGKCGYFLPEKQTRKYSWNNIWIIIKVYMHMYT